MKKKPETACFIKALLKPDAYPHPVTAEIELIETHISWVLLTGDYAYKIKKNLQFDFLDFSTLEKRHFYCQEELRLNRRFAPDLYVQVVPITETLGQLHINGEGEVIEYAVQMRQFASQQLLSTITDQGRLTSVLIDQLAYFIADFHYHADTDTSASHYGTVAEIQHWFLGNFVTVCPLLQQETPFLQQLTQLKNWGKQQCANNAAFMQQRKQYGFIRECHGDLHLGNIALFENRITPFDGIEFNPALRWIDVMNEVAFVVMDLQERGIAHFAYRFLNRYLSATRDYQGLRVLRYYLVYRALVRTKVALLRWQQHNNAQDFSEAKNYANLAESFSHLKPPILVITHGFSGSGKSTLGVQVAETLGLIHIRSDVERQRLFGMSKQDNRAINQGIYSTENVLLIYQTLHDLAASIIDAGFSVLIDATFLQAEQRFLFQQLAIEQQLRFLILDVYAPDAELRRRISQRQQHSNDASEATLAVLEHQLKTAQPLSSVEQDKSIQIDSVAAGALESAFKQIAGFLI